MALSEVGLFCNLTVNCYYTSLLREIAIGKTIGLDEISIKLQRD